MNEPVVCPRCGKVFRREEATPAVMDFKGHGWFFESGFTSCADATPEQISQRKKVLETMKEKP